MEADGGRGAKTNVKFAILGAGGWGTAVAVVLSQNPAHRVSLWSARPTHAAALQHERENRRYLPGVPIPPAVELTTDIDAAAAEADLLITAIPTIYLRDVLLRCAGHVPPVCPALSLTKGIEIATFRRPTEIIAETLGPRPVAVLSGPSHAEEVARGMPTTVVVASRNYDLARWIQQRFTSERFRVYTNQDLIGVELAGALKNVISIAAGISDGLGFGDNAKSALLARGLAEMARFGVALGAEQATFWGLAGMGDLITTCISRHGRNRQVGFRLGQGEKPAAILAGMAMIAEGVYTARSVHDRAQRMGIDMPITTEVYQVLYEDKDPRQAVASLMLREPKHEI
ncbi:MAG: NAD(P)-dependent glycerol-3-phosphate dehydrogenase [Gemmataceae bacterium]|nr:NAD(P)-dependent glycerol-3-phosphate dehydrogenase [Gemmataceae bacterium]